MSQGDEALSAHFGPVAPGETARRRGRAFKARSPTGAPSRRGVGRERPCAPEGRGRRPGYARLLSMIPAATSFMAVTRLSSSPEAKASPSSAT